MRDWSEGSVIRGYPKWGCGYFLNWRMGLGFMVSPYRKDRGVAVWAGPLMVWVWLAAYTEGLRED